MPKILSFKYWVHFFGFLLLKTSGWSVKGAFADGPNVTVVAPHTSQWDVWVGLKVKWYLNLDCNFLVKNEFLQLPIAGWYLKGQGAIGVTRSKSLGQVKQIVDQFKLNRIQRLVFTPEGSRSWRPYWKSGFYRIAQQARVPIQLIGFDYKKKVVHCGPSLNPEDAFEENIQIIKNFYKKIKAKYPSKFSTIKFNDMG